MATRVFTDEELVKLRSFPEITPNELIRFFTLTPADIEFIDPGRGRGPADRIGLAVQLCTLPWLGFVPDDVTSAPAAAVARLSDQLRIPVGELPHYAAKREQTRTDHLLQVARYLRWRQAKALELKELDEFLLARGMEHDSPSLLFTLACEHLKSSRVIRLGAVKLLERVATARAEAGRETYSRVAHLLTPSMMAELDGLLHYDAAVRGTRLKWLTTPPVSDSPTAIKAEIGKLAFLRDLDAHTMDLSMLPAERRRFLHSVGHRLTGQALLRRESSRRHPILLAVLAQSAVGTLDDVVALFDQAVSAREGRAKRKLTAALANRAKSAEERLAVLDEILPTVVDVGIPDEEVGAILRGLGLERLRGALATAAPRLPRDHGHLALMQESYNHLREFTPAVLETVEFAGGTTAAGLLEAVKVLKGLNRRKGRNVPDGAPDDFVPARWRGYLADAVAVGDSVAYRHFWELTVLLALRDGLRSGDIWVPGSRRYADPASYLFTPAQWEPKRAEFCHLVGKSPKAADALKAAFAEHAAAMADLEGVLAKSKGKVGEVRIDDAGDLVIPQLTAEDVPAQVDELRKELISRLPFAPIASLLIELDRRTGFLECFTHAGGKQARSPQLKRNLLAVLIGHATNLGLTRMAEATGISYDILAWTAEWYLREDTLAAANAAIVDYHHRLPLTQAFGGGTLSSSDGQRFPVRGKSTTARAAKKWFADRGLSTYTWVSDQFSTYGTKIIVVTHREAQYVLDEIMGNATDLPITEHATDTHGVTLVNFALFDLVGLQLSPRIRDLGKVTLYRTGPRAEAAKAWPNGGGLLRQIAETADLDAELTDRFLTDPRLRAAAAANPTLAPEHVAALAHDPDNQVRAAIVARRGLDPVLRESIQVEYDDRASGNTVDWLLTEDLSEPDQLAFARSRHQVLRKTLTMRTDLTDEAVEILAADESFAVRLFVCERQPNAPGWLLAQIAADWKSYSRWDMLAHKNFPAEAATTLARGDDAHDRVVAAAHPGLPSETIDALLSDEDDHVRRRAATNPGIPAERLITLLEADESAVVAGAAANPTLPIAMMHQVLAQAGV